MNASALRRRLRDDPDDLASWLAYADHLQERGDARGELIRLEQRRAHARPAGPAAVRSRIDTLVEEHQQSWDAALPPGVTVLRRRYGFATKVAVTWSPGAPALIEHVLRDELVTALSIRPDDADVNEMDAEPDEFGDVLMPVFSADQAGPLAALDLGRLVELDLEYFPIGDVGARALAASLGRGRVRALDLRYCGLGDDGLATLAASPHFRELRTLRLQGNEITAAGVYALARFERLTELDLRYNPVGEEGVDALLTAPFVPSLKRLFLQRTDITDAGVRKLASASPLPPALRSLWRAVEHRPS
jgi:uncharacterized protein (TIGR02996 family)